MIEFATDSGSGSGPDLLARTPEASPDAPVRGQDSGDDAASLVDGSSAQPSLLEGAVLYSGKDLASTSVTVTIQGTAVGLSAIPGQVVLFLNTPVPSAKDAEAWIDSYGATVLAALPMVGAYLVGVQSGDEDSLIQAVQHDVRILSASPNLILSGEADAAAPPPANAPYSGVAPDAGSLSADDAGTLPSPIIAILEDDCVPFPPDGGDNSHAALVATVLRTNGAMPTHCYFTKGAFALNDAGQPFLVESDLWQVLLALIAGVDPAGPSRPVFINLSIGADEDGLKEACVLWHQPRNSDAGTGGGLRDKNAERLYELRKYTFWFNVISALVAAFDKHSDAQPWVAVSISAGNYGVSLDERMQLLHDNPAPGAGARRTVLSNNIMIVTQAQPNRAFEPRFDYVENWTEATATVIATDNSWSAYGTSFAAPYALAQARYRFANRMSPTPSQAIIDLRAASSAGHVVPAYTGDNPPLPAPAAGEIALSKDDLFNCPIGSVWEPSLGTCTFGYFALAGQEICPVGGLYSGSTAPWIATLQWPSLQVSFGLGTPTWSAVDRKTCAFDLTTTSAAVPATPAIVQETKGAVSCGCSVVDLDLLTNTDLCTAKNLDVRPGPGTCALRNAPLPTNCGTVLAVSPGSPAQVYGQFSAPIATFWPALPSDVSLACDSPAMTICSWNATPPTLACTSCARDSRGVCSCVPNP
jgi:hypothetical protein